MSLSDEIARLRESIIKTIKENVPVQNVWCTVKSVDWDAKTMVCISTTDKLEYHDVLLGLDMLYKKPKVNTKCLISALENKEAQAYMVICDEVDAIEFQTTDAALKLKIEDDVWTWNDGNNKGLVKMPAAKEQYNKIENKLNQLIQIFSGWIPVPNDGGAALKTALGTWVSQNLTLTEESDIENTKIKH